MITISLAEEKDAKGVAHVAHQVSSVHAENVPTEFKPLPLASQTKHLKSLIQSGEATILKAELEGQIVGYVTLCIHELPKALFVHAKKGSIASIGVDSDCRGHGVGSFLLQAAEEYFKERGVKVVELDVYPFNLCTTQLYDKFGYETLKLHKRKFLK